MIIVFWLAALSLSVVTFFFAHEQHHVHFTPQYYPSPGFFDEDIPIIVPPKVILAAMPSSVQRVYKLSVYTNPLMDSLNVHRERIRSLGYRVLWTERWIRWYHRK